MQITSRSDTPCPRKPASVPLLLTYVRFKMLTAPVQIVAAMQMVLNDGRINLKAGEGNELSLELASETDVLKQRKYDLT